MKSIKEALYQAMLEITWLELEELSEIWEMNLFENGILDSLSFVSLINNIEDELEIKIDLKAVKIEDLMTMEGIENYIREQL